MSDTETLLLDRYSIVHIERASSFSKIFFALDTYQSPPRSCLVKVFEPIIQKHQVASWIETEFNREAKHLKQLSLSNRNLAEIYSYSSGFQVYYLVRELIEGEPLSKTVELKGKFSSSEVRELLLRLLPVIDYLHQAGIVHQNIKPKNIILRQDDRTPMLINFGSIKQIVSTYGFYRDKQMFSTSNIYGYAPSEQALGKSVPASDLYSLGLTALYLLTGKNPVDLPVDSETGNVKVPQAILRQDSNLAAIITRVINTNIGDRYQSATAMLKDLEDRKIKHHNRQSSNQNSGVADSKQDRHLAPAERQKPAERRNWWQLAIVSLAILYLLGVAAFALVDWNLSRSIAVRSLPEPNEPILPPITPSESFSAAPVEPLALNSPPEEVIEIPIFPTGTTKDELRAAIGEPNAIQKGYWVNSIAWIYKRQAENAIDLGYLFDVNTDRLRQTEVAISPSVNLGTIQDILASLLEGNITPTVERELERVYSRQTNEYSFQSGNLEGSIEREADGHLYLGVWEQDFH